MIKTMQGKVYVLGNNIDTDQIIPAEHLVYSMTNKQEARQYGHFALSGVPGEKAGLPQGHTPFITGDQHRSEYAIILAGANFGCGSSREHAPFALNQAGIKAVIAVSYARIFYRNAVDGGFLIPLELVANQDHQFKTGDLLEIDLVKYIIRNSTNGKEYKLKLPGDVLPIIEAGGLFPYARQTGMIKKINRAGGTAV
jgi:3-isopropylmalate/(R)-2-methylmalate dehydratase small subunit